MQNSQGPQAWTEGAHWSLGYQCPGWCSSYTSLGWTDIVSHIPGKQNSGLAETHHRIDQTALVSCFCGAGLGPRVWAVGTHLFLRNGIITGFPVPHTLHPTMLQKTAILRHSQVLAATVPGLAERLRCWRSPPTQDLESLPQGDSYPVTRVALWSSCQIAVIPCSLSLNLQSITSLELGEYFTVSPKSRITATTWPPEPELLGSSSESQIVVLGATYIQSFHRQQVCTPNAGATVGSQDSEPRTLAPQPLRAAASRTQCCCSHL